LPRRKREKKYNLFIFLIFAAATYNTMGRGISAAAAAPGMDVFGLARSAKRQLKSPKLETRHAAGAALAAVAAPRKNTS
jgi:hypothetical protein